MSGPTEQAPTAKVPGLPAGNGAAAPAGEASDSPVTEDLLEEIARSEGPEGHTLAGAPGEAVLVELLGEPVLGEPSLADLEVLAAEEPRSGGHRGGGRHSR